MTASTGIAAAAENESVPGNLLPGTWRATPEPETGVALDFFELTPRRLSGK